MERKHDLALRFDRSLRQRVVQGGGGNELGGARKFVAVKILCKSKQCIRVGKYPIKILRNMDRFFLY